MPKKLLLLSLSVLGAVTLASCSDDSHVIHFYTDDIDGLKKDLLYQAKSEFDKLNTGYTVSIEPQGKYGVLKEKILTQLPNGRQPDLAMAYQDHVAEYKEARYKGEMQVLDMKKLIDKDKDFNLNDIFSEYDENISIRDKGDEWYILPFTKASEAVYYNKKLINYYNKKNPSAKIKAIGDLETILKDSKYRSYYNTWTWDELFDTATKLTTFVHNFKEADKTELEDEGLLDVYNNKANFVGISFDSADNALIQELVKDDKYIKADGKDAASKLVFLQGEKENTKTILEKYYNYRNSTHPIYRARINNGNSRVDHDITNACSGIVITSTSHSGAMSKEIKDKKKDIELGIAMRPSDPDAPKVISQGPSLVMFNQPKLSTEERQAKAEATFQFVKVLTSAEFSAKYSTGLGYVPVRKSSYETKTMKDFLASKETDKLIKETINITKATLDGKTLVYSGATPTNTSGTSAFQPKESEVLKYFFTESFSGSDNVRWAARTLFEYVSSKQPDQGEDVTKFINREIERVYKDLKPKIK